MAPSNPRPKAQGGTARTAPRTSAPRKPALQSRLQPSGNRCPPVRRGRPLGKQGFRLRSGLFILGAVVVLLAGRLIQVQGFHPSAYADAGVQQTQSIVLPALRGEVLDRNGNPLAVSVLAKNIYAEPKVIAKAVCQPGATDPCDAATIAAKVAPMLGLAVSDVQAKLSNGKTFVYLKHGIDPRLAAQIIALNLPGIGQESTTVRTHPSHSLAAAELGFTNYDGDGASGIELAMNKYLSGVDGKTIARFDSQGRVIPTSGDSHTDPVDGDNITLTLDEDLQWYAQSLIAAQVKATQAINGTIVVEDIKTGQVLTMATAPTFDPDKPIGAGVDYGNPAISDVYEPGSVNKVITASAALQRGIVTPTTVIDVPNRYYVGGRYLSDAENHGLEHLTFTGVLAKSSNIGTVKVAQQVGAQGLYDTMRAFGFGSPSGIGLPADQDGLLPKPADWSNSSISTIPIGQGVSTTVMQVASVYSTIANNGIRVQPSIVKGITTSAGKVVPIAPAAQRRVISASVATTIREMLESTVSDEGTAPLAAVPGYLVAGKTGTAQRIATSGPHAGHYDGTYTSSFVGMAPADNPRFVVAVVLQGTGKKGYFGGSVSAPLFSKVMGFALRSYGIPPTNGRRPHFAVLAP